MSECVVVGGGLIGMLTAQMLHDEGVSVTLLERGEPGREASWAGGGILSPLYPWRYPEPVTLLAQLGQGLYPEFCRRLSDKTGVDPQWTPSGLLVLDRDEFGEALDWGGRHDPALEVLDGDALRARAPALSERFSGALWLPGVAQVRNPRLMKALRRSLEMDGVTVRSHTAVTGLAVSGGRVSGVDTASGRIGSDAVVLACGAWTSELLDVPGPAIKVEPVKGQMILFRAEPDTLTQIVLYRDRYLIPRRDGRILAGSTLEYVGFDKSTTEAARKDLVEAAAGMVPALEGRPIEHHWAGLRPGAPSSIPYIGPHPDIEGLFVNAGHFRNGVVLGMGSVRLLADLILRNTPALQSGHYALNADR